jgi:hypothetical protein
MKLSNRDLLFLLTILLILCAMFTKSPFMDDAAKITLGTLLGFFAQELKQV